MHFPLVLVLLVAVLQPFRVCRGSKIVFKTTNIECITYPKYAENSSCVIKAINWNKAVAQMDVDLVQPIRNISVRSELFKKGYNNRYHPFLINSEFNFCDVISKRNFFTYGTIMFKVLKPYSNVNHSCPYSGHLFARKLDIDGSYFPPFPLGFYLTQATFIENFPQEPSELIGVVKFYFESKEMVEIKKKPKV